MPTSLRDRGSGPATDYLLVDLQSESPVSTCKSFCSHLISVYHTSFTRECYFKKPQTTQQQKNLRLFLLHFSLSHCLCHTVVFFLKMCFAAEQSSYSLAKELQGCPAGLLLAGVAQSKQQHWAAPRHQTCLAPAAAAVPSENPGLVYRSFGIHFCCLPCCLYSTHPELHNHWQVLALPQSYVFLP